jgi:hypothetical protein
MDGLNVDPTLVDFTTDLLGFRPLEAFVAFAIPNGPQSGSMEIEGLVSRVPKRQGPKWRETLSSRVLESVLSAQSVRIVILVRYSSDVYGEGPVPVGYDVARSVCKRLHEAGHAFAAFVVAADGWGEYRFDDDADAEFGRQSLDELRPYPIRNLSALRAAP